MAIIQPKLPYATDALEPVISTRTVKIHYGAHMKKYFDTANELMKGTVYDDKELDELINGTNMSRMGSKLFNNLCQAYNHAFFFDSLCAENDTEAEKPSAELLEQIKDDFGTLKKLEEDFSEAAKSQFGSGWTWLIWNKGRLQVRSTPNAGCPLTTPGQIPLLVLDVWEHAYYLDYHQERADYVDAIWKIVNWKVVNDRFAAATKKDE